MSYSSGELFFLISDPVNDPKKIRAEYDEIEVKIHPGSSFVCVDSGRANWKPRPRPGMEKLSRTFKEVIDLQVSDYGFRFEHWKDGGLGRRLFWTEDAAWETEGAPETWEAAAFPAGPPRAGSMEPLIAPLEVSSAIRSHFKLPPSE